MLPAFYSGLPNLDVSTRIAKLYAAGCIRQTSAMMTRLRPPNTETAVMPMHPVKPMLVPTTCEGWSNLDVVRQKMLQTKSHWQCRPDDQICNEIITICDACSLHCE